MAVDLNALLSDPQTLYYMLHYDVLSYIASLYQLTQDSRLLPILEQDITNFDDIFSILSEVCSDYSLRPSLSLVFRRNCPLSLDNRLLLW